MMAAVTNDCTETSLFVVGEAVNTVILSQSYLASNITRVQRSDIFLFLCGR